MGGGGGGCWVVGTWRGVILNIRSFSKLKTAFCKYWTSNKIKISMSMNCVNKEYEIKTKMIQQQWLQLKMKFFLGYNMSLLEEWAIFWLVEGGCSHPSQEEKLCSMLLMLKDQGGIDTIFPCHFVLLILTCRLRCLLKMRGQSGNNTEKNMGASVFCEAKIKYLKAHNTL